MSFWNFLGGFALFNAVCDMFSSKPKRTYAPTQQHYHDYGHEDYLALGRDESGIDALKDRVDELQGRIDELQDRIDSLEEWEDIQDELDDLRDELDDLDFDRDLYDDHDDW